MENNTFFGCLLRGFGFEVLSVGGRVSHETTGRRDGGWAGWSHMVNLVRVEGRRYLVDVGFGGDGPCCAIPLERGEGGIVFGGVAPQELRLEWKSLPKHTDPEQRVWVYSHRENRSAEWVEAYCFTEVEFFPEDFAIMNLATMTLRESYFVQTVLAQRFMLEEEVVEEGDLEDQANGWQGRSGGTNDGGNRPRAVGVMILHKDLVKRRMADKVEMLTVLESEADRAAALKKYFKIEFGEEERRGIRDLPTELRGDGGSGGGGNTDQVRRGFKVNGVRKIKEKV